MAEFKDYTTNYGRALSLELKKGILRRATHLLVLEVVDYLKYVDLENASGPAFEELEGKIVQTAQLIVSGARMPVVVVETEQPQVNEATLSELAVMLEPAQREHEDNDPT